MFIGRSFGYFYPSTQPISLETAQRDGIIKLLSQGINSGIALRRVVGGLAPHLPSFQILSIALQDVEIDIAPGTHPAAEAQIHSDSLRRLVFTSGYPLKANFSHFINAFAAFLPPPDGIDLNLFQGIKSKEDFKKALWNRHTWGVVLSTTFVFQVAQEMMLSGIDIFRPHEEPSLITPVDLCLYGAMKAGGLVRMVEVYPAVRSQRLGRVMGEHIEAAAADYHLLQAQLKQGRAWSPSPGLRDACRSVSVLDDSYQAHAAQGRGFFEAQCVGKLSKKNIGFKWYSQKKITSESDWDELINIIRVLAPRLWTHLSDVSQRDTLRYVVCDDLQDVTAYTFSYGYLMGHGGSAPILSIKKGSLYQEVLPYLVAYLGRLAVPQSKLPQWMATPILSVEQDRKYTEEYLYKRFQVMDIWGYSAMFEFAHEATQCGISFPLTPVNQDKLRMIKSGGLEIFRQFWPQLVNPDWLQHLLSSIRAMTADVQAEMVLASSLNIGIAN